MFAHHIYAMPTYAYIAPDYPTVLCLFYHHIYLGGFLIIGGGAHASIYIIGDSIVAGPDALAQQDNIGSQLTIAKQQVLNHRHLIIGH